jgi:phospholipid transport system substrate-binding protein
MKMSVRRRGRVAPSPRGESVGIIAGQESAIRNALSGGMNLAWITLILLVSGHGAAATEKNANARPKSESAVRTEEASDPNSRWWAKWDAQIKDPNDPNELLAAKWGAVVRVLQAQDLDQKLKERIIDQIVSPTFDFQLMGQLALGRTHWPKLDAAQREKFVRLFETRLKALYLEKTSLYKNQKTVLKPAERKKNLVQIPMILTSEEGETALLYKLSETGDPTKIRTGGRWRIYDVEINGVSILLTYRSQFDDILRHGTVQDLLAQMEKPPSQ